MGRTAGQKVKLLYIVQFLQDYTDETHPMSTRELIERLAEVGIPAERKSIYDDIDELVKFGYDIVTAPSRLGGGYYMASREFELAEVKLLVDVVQSSRFISTKKSKELIDKLEKLVSRNDAGQLERQILVAGRVKTENESIYYNVDTIHRAIQEDRRILFQYLDWNKSKKLVPRENAEKCVSPWALVYRDENYYLVAFDSGDQRIKHYRVDKMGRMALDSAAREGEEEYQKLDISSYTNRTFGMFAGQEEDVCIEFPEQLVGVVIDRFGKNVVLKRVRKGTLCMRTKVAVSGQFFGWVAGLGAECVITSPTSLAKRYMDWLDEIMISQAENTPFK